MDGLEVAFTSILGVNALVLFIYVVIAYRREERTK